MADMRIQRPCTDKRCEGVVKLKVVALGGGRVKLTETCTACGAVRERTFRSAAELGRYFVRGK